MKKYTLDEVYTADMTAFQRERYNRVADEFEKLFGEKPTAFFSAPGRTEVGGNHTDHNFGCVLAAGAFHSTLLPLSLLIPKRTLLQ